MARLGHGRRKVPAHMSRTPRRAATSVYVFPREKKYPIGDLYHARMALGGPYASSGYTTPATRAEILQAVAEEYPQYNWASYWNNHIMGNKKPRRRSKDGRKLTPLYNWDVSVGAKAAPKRRVAANPRRKNVSRRRNYGRIRILRNPDGMPLGKGTAVRVPGGKRSHILNERSGYALCGAGKLGNLKPSAAKKITCYRCIKIRIVDSGDDVERMLATEPGKRRTHMMVPGGRQGRYVSGVRPSDVMHGEEMFVGGTLEHPSQTRLLTSRQKAKRLADLRKKRSRKVAPGRRVAARGEMVANPRSYKQGYQRGSKDYRSTQPTPASQLKQRTESYQFGYLEGYADAADRKYSKPRKNTRRRTNKRRRNTRRRR